MAVAMVKFQNVSKTYSISRYKYQRLSESFNDLINKLVTRKKRTLVSEKFWALKNASFDINEGDALGIIGKNGSGKSTILKLISNITYPNSGKVISSCKRIGAFIELGAGLHPDLSGRENIYLYGSILGMTRLEISEKFNDIINFAEIHKFLDTPIKRYSSGMYARLGFSVCAFSNPDILLIDEVLAVGDTSFQKKCLLKMQEFKRNKKTIVFVSHDLKAISSICSKCLLLDQGHIKMIDSPARTIRTYIKSYASRSIS